MLLECSSHQSNLMVMDPAGYTSAPFARFGLPLFIASVACGGRVDLTGILTPSCPRCGFTTGAPRLWD
jgi:hypothetical protein